MHREVPSQQTRQRKQDTCNQKLRKNAETEEANKDALSYLQVGLAKLDLFFSGQWTNIDMTIDEVMIMKKTIYNEIQ